MPLLLLLLLDILVVLDAVCVCVGFIWEPWAETQSKRAHTNKWNNRERKEGKEKKFRSPPHARIKSQDSEKVERNCRRQARTHLQHKLRIRNDETLFFHSFSVCYASTSFFYSFRFLFCPFL